ncbi:hypothetical protein QYB59_001513 [Clostridium perfringens]|nr:hypothetical protein [Clostridium perfringens]
MKFKCINKKVEIKELRRRDLIMKKAMDLVRVLVKVTFLGYDEKEDLR